MWLHLRRLRCECAFCASVMSTPQPLAGDVQVDWFAPIVADAEAGFGGPLNCFELMKSMIKAGAAGVHFEDQLSSEKKCGHLGGKASSTTHLPSLILLSLEDMNEPSYLSISPGLPRWGLILAAALCYIHPINLL